jgi:hypothetical protein
MDRIPHSWLVAAHGWLHGLHGFVNAALAAIMSFVLALFSTAGTKVVHTTGELHRAVATSKGGARILLAPGEYAFFIDKTARNFGPAGLTITSQDLSHPAVVSGVNVSNWRHVIFSDLIVRYSVEQNGMFDVGSSDHITLDHLDIDGGGSKGIGVNMGYGCSFCTLQNSIIHDLSGGVVVNGTQLTGYPNATFTPNAGPVLISHNEVYNNTDDGIHGGYANRTTMVHNTFHDMINPGDGSHADAIQFEGLHYGAHYTMDDEVVTDNLIYQGKSDYGMQGVFLHGDNKADQFNRPVIARNTVCVAGQHNGVFLSGGVDFSVKDNYVVGQMTMKVFVHESLRGVVAGNTTNNLDVFENQGVTVGQNILLPAPADCAAALAHAAQTGAGAGPHASLGPRRPGAAPGPAQR